MKIYIDTEFNEFDGDLISMALVAENGDEFYEVLDLPSGVVYGNWVQEHVVPLLEKDSVEVDVFQYKFQKFLNQYSNIHLIADWPDDIKYFCKMLITGPGLSLNHPPITMEIRSNLSSADSKVPHNALHDARAIADHDLGTSYVN